MIIKRHSKISQLITASFLVSLSFFILLYVQYFQTYGLSLKRGLLGVFFVAGISFLIFSTIRFVNKNFAGSLREMGLWMLLAFLLSPNFFPYQHYPFSPFFQATSRLNLRIQTFGESVQLKGVWLRFDNKEYSYKDFQFSDAWMLESGRYFLRANSQGEINWLGRIGERATLTVFPMDAASQITVLWDGEESNSLLSDKPFVVNKKSTTPIWYYILITLARIVSLGFVFFIFFSIYRSISDGWKKKVVIFVLLALLAASTVYAQFENPEIKGRLDELQVGRHAAVLAGTAPNPWQYRVFSEWLIAGMVDLADVFGFRQAYAGVFVLIRVFQNALIFILAYLYFRKLGFSDLVSLVGIIFVTGALLNSFHQSDLSFNTYFDVIFYLGAVLLILLNDFVWLPILMLVASLNRETSGLIPFLAISNFRDFRMQGSKRINVLLSLGVWGLTFIALRICYPENTLFIPYGQHPGLPLLGYNLTSFSLILFLRFITFAPLVGFIYYKKWSPVLRHFFIMLVPVWVVVHFIGSVISETRLFLVPQLLVFIPIFLVAVQSQLARQVNNENVHLPI